MSEWSTCRCPICVMERAMLHELGDENNVRKYLELTSHNLVLSAFPTAQCLLRHLRDAATRNNGETSSDSLVGELLRTYDDHLQELRQCLLLLALVPAAHKTSRQIATSFPALVRDDIAQHLLISILEIVQSNSFKKQESHFAFTVTRLMRRKGFRWAIREAKLMPPPEAASGTVTEPASEANTRIEPQVLLRNFLDGCLATGKLTEADYELLILFKIRGVSSEELAARQGLSEKAFRRRMQRVIEKLRRFALSAQLSPAKHRTVPLPPRKTSRAIESRAFAA